MTLDELTPWLFARTTGGIRWGLERTEEMLAGVGNPHRLFRSLLIGGTNGKGSTAALCEAVLRRMADGREDGTTGGREGPRGGDESSSRPPEGRLRVGLYTSPHLVSFAERVRVNGVPVAEEVLADAALRLRPAIERTGASFFEATTAMAFLAFAEADVDVAVVEVGLGGRLDSTNVLTPMVTGVTNVALDHTEYLGETLEQIAAEKAGIFKRGVPAISGVVEPELEAILRRRAEEAGAPFLQLDALVAVRSVEVRPSGTRLSLESEVWGPLDLEIALAGGYQARNATMATALLGALPADVRPTKEAVMAGFARARWPGRLQVVRIRGTTWLFDVAHNPAGVSALAESIPLLDLPRPWVLLAGILSDKGWREMLPPLLRQVDAAVLTVPPTAPAVRRWDPQGAADWARSAGFDPPRVIPDFGAAIQRVQTMAPYGTVLVTGSVHTVGDAMRELDVASY